MKPLISLAMGEIVSFLLLYLDVFSIGETVAERISYFCLARNLIRPLGSTDNFTQSG